MMRSSRIPPPFWALIFAVAMWASDHAGLDPLVVPVPVRRVGPWLMVVAALAPAAALIQLRRARTTVNSWRPAAARTLVTSGMYAWSRNPMYLGLALALLGWALELGTPAALGGPLLFIPFIHWVQIRPEERALRRRFGEDYARYCGRVNRWFGRRRRD